MLGKAAEFDVILGLVTKRHMKKNIIFIEAKNISDWGVIYHSIYHHSSFLGTLKSKKTNSSVYGILKESLYPKDIKSYQIIPNIFKYREFGESKVLV